MLWNTQKWGLRRLLPSLLPSLEGTTLIELALFALESSVLDVEAAYVACTLSNDTR